MGKRRPFGGIRMDPYPPNTDGRFATHGCFKHVWLSLGGVRRNADEDALLTSGVTLLFDIGAQLHKV